MLRSKPYKNILNRLIVMMRCDQLLFSGRPKGRPRFLEMRDFQISNGFVYDAEVGVDCSLPREGTNGWHMCDVRHGSLLVRCAFDWRDRRLRRLKYDTFAALVFGLVLGDWRRAPGSHCVSLETAPCNRSVRCAV